MFNNKTEKDKKSLEKAKSLIISIIIAIFLWVTIVNIVNPDVTTKIHNIPIQVNGLYNLREKGLVIVNSNKLPTCSITIRGKRSNIIESQNRIYAVVNLSDIMMEGVAKIPVTINSPSSINLEKQSISYIDANIEPLMKKNIPIQIKQINEPKNILIKTESEKETIEISGSKKDLDKISACIVTPDVSNIKEDTNIVYSFAYLSPDGEQIPKPDTVSSSETHILLKHTIYDKKTAKPKFTLPDNLSELYRTDISYDDLLKKEVYYGVRSDMEPLEYIDYTLDVEKISNGQNKIALQAMEIENVYIPKNQLVLNFKADKLVTKDVSLNITIENLDQALSASIISSNEYLMTGTEEELESVNASIDLSNATEGTKEFPIKFKNNDLQNSNSHYATVIINRKGE